MITLHDSDFFRLVEYMKANYGINLESKRHLVEGRLCNLVSEKGFSSFQEYFDHVLNRASKEETMLLLNKLTTNHTFFMREEEHFRFFQKTVLPMLQQNVRDRDLRIWSAGCSSGEEPYTLAIIMQEFFGMDAPSWDKKILATDISMEVLQKAHQGIYLKEDMEKLEPVWKTRYFTKAGPDAYQVSDALKREVIFRVFNLMDDFPFRRKFHVIFCRNVMIYFDQPTKDALIHKLYDMIEEGGYLFIGLSESIRREESPFTYIMPSVYRKESYHESKRNYQGVDS